MLSSSFFCFPVFCKIAQPPASFLGNKELINANVPQVELSFIFVVIDGLNFHLGNLFFIFILFIVNDGLYLVFFFFLALFNTILRGIKRCVDNSEGQVQ